MSQLGGIKELTKNIFEKIPVTIATPKTFQIHLELVLMSQIWQQLLD